MTIHELPEIDISGFCHGWDKADSDAKSILIKAIDDACTDTGFFYLTGHGVVTSVIDDLRDKVVGYFNQPDQVKRALTVEADNYRGYVPLGFFTPNDGQGPADQYESFKLHLEIDPTDPICAECDLYGPNRWPDQPTGFRQAVTSYWQALDRCGDVLFQAMLAALGLNGVGLQNAFNKSLTNMTLLHYPPMGKSQGGFGIHPHKDTDAFTILYPDPVGGLQVRHRDGSWLDAKPPVGAFIVNIGDMIEVWSGGRYVSTPHRVINRTGKERYSFPWFAVPRHDILIEPLIEPQAGFDRVAISSGEWSRAVWYTNYPNKIDVPDGVQTGSLRD